MLPILEGVTAGALLLSCPSTEGVTTQVAPGLPLDRSGRRAGAKRPDVLPQDISRPAKLLTSPGQARQTIRTYHMVVRRLREGHVLARRAACGRGWS